MFGDVVLIRQEWAYTAQLQDALSAVQHGQLVHGGKVFAQLLIVQAVADLAPAALAGVEGIDGLLAQRLVQFLQRGRLLTAQEQGGIAVADDGIGAVLIQRFQLGLRLKHQAGGNLTASDGRHQLFQIGNLTDVGALVNEAAHMNRQTPAELVIRLFTEQIKELAVNHGNEEVKGAVRVAHDEEQHGLLGIALFGSAQRIQLQFIIHGDLPKLLNVKGSKARTGGNIDRFSCFAGGQLVFSPLAHGKVVGVTLAELPECDIYVVFKGFIILTHLHCIDEFHIPMMRWPSKKNPTLIDRQKLHFLKAHICWIYSLLLCAFRVINVLPNQKEDFIMSETTGLTISIPLDKVAVGNLTNLLDAKGTLIKKALGIAELPIIIEEDVISFPWFEAMPAAEECTAYTAFIAALCQMSIKQKRINSAEKPTDNEKYAFRCFLLRLGFIGDAHKATRKILLKNLTGSSAFRNGSPAKEVHEDAIS